MDKREKILKSIKELSNLDYSLFEHYSLTINLKNIVNNFENRKINLDEIKNHINNFDGEINSYNLTFSNLGVFNEKRYSGFFMDVNFILTSDESLIDIIARFSEMRYLPIKENISIKETLDFINFYEKSARELYEKSNEIINYGKR